MSEVRFTIRRGESALVVVDTEDVELIASLPTKRIKSGYACYEPVIGGRKRTRLVHRLLMGLEEGDRRTVDHIDRNRLNNQRSNLRVVSLAENQQNLSPMTHRKGIPVRSRYRGVTRFRGRWRAMVQVHGRRYYLGLFDDELAAARSVQRKLLQLVVVRPT